MGLPSYMITVTGISVVATWLYNHSGGSVLLTMVFHASVNATQSFYPIEDMFSPAGEFARASAWVLLVIVMIALPQSGFFERRDPEGTYGFTNQSSSSI